LEGGLRSLNNIVQKFHRVYFFYYLVSPNSFLSIAYYFPALALQLLALAVHQYNGWHDGSSMKASLAIWLQAYISAAMIYFGHIYLYEEFLKPGTTVNDLLGSWSPTQMATLVISVNLFWPLIASGRM
jgi:hypothetical protein